MIREVSHVWYLDLCAKISLVNIYKGEWIILSHEILLFSFSASSQTRSSLYGKNLLLEEQILS